MIDKLFRDLFANKQGNSLILIFNIKYGYKIFRLMVIAVSITYIVACGWWFYISNYIKNGSNFIVFANNTFFKDNNFNNSNSNTTNYDKYIFL